MDMLTYYGHIKEPKYTWMILAWLFRFKVLCPNCYDAQNILTL